MGLWSKGINRSKTGEIRLEENISILISFTISFLYRFFKGEHVGKVSHKDGILYVQLGGYGGRAKVVERTHVGMMKTLLNCVDNILVHTRDVRAFFVLRDRIQRNLNKYDETHVLKDLYY